MVIEYFVTKRMRSAYVNQREFELKLGAFASSYNSSKSVSVSNIAFSTIATSSNFIIYTYTVKQEKAPSFNSNEYRRQPESLRLPLRILHQSSSERLWSALICFVKVLNRPAKLQVPPRGISSRSNIIWAFELRHTAASVTLYIDA